MKNSRTALSVSLLLVLGLVGCKPTVSPAPAAVTPPAESAAWTAFTTAFLDGYFKLNPDSAVYQGRHEFDGQLPDWSAAGLKRQAEFLKDQIVAAEKIDAASLSAAQLLERDYLISVARGNLFWLEDADAPHNNVSWYFGKGLDPNVYIARPYADAAVRMKAFIQYARNIPAAMALIKANVRTPMPLSHVDYAVPGFKGFADYYLRDAKLAFAGVQDKALQADFDAATKPAAAAMRDMANWAESQRKTATQDFALGEDRFRRMLSATEGVDTPLPELEAVGRADLKRNQEALKSACARYAPKASLQGCMDKMNLSKGEGGPVAEARRQLPTLRQFLEANDIVTIPGTEQALVEESPPYNRQNAAYIDLPGPYDIGLPSVYYISPPDPKWTAKEQNDYVPGKMNLLFTSVHEVWPGHFLNFLHANRAKSLFGRVFVGYAFAEGWAHYSEEMMWEAGLNKGDDETHIGQLSNALLRNCRFLSAIGMHARGMTQEQSKAMFLNECYQDPGSAKQQSARGTYDPAYLNYTMGKLMIRKLREDWTQGDRSRWKAFHDAFLSYGGPPIPLVRKAMLGGEAKAVF